MTLTRYDIEEVIEEWRDCCIMAGIDWGGMTVLFDPNLLKDLAREILVKVRESS